MGGDVTATINYFPRDPKFLYEKPYVTSFPVEHIEGAQVSNHESDPVSVTITDLRGASTPSLEEEGFTVLTAPTSLSYDDFSSRDKVRSAYFSELREILKAAFPAYRTFVFFDHEACIPFNIPCHVRRRSEKYPSSVGETVEHAQPLAQTHIDYSVNGGLSRIHRVLETSDSLHLQDRPCDLLNIWRPIVRQTNDWPLALCDFRSINPANDVLANDVVYENSVGEDELLMRSEDHRWCYLSNHTRDEIFVWRNTNLPNGGKPRAFHTAFENPLGGLDGVRRESIEVRVAAFS